MWSQHEETAWCRRAPTTSAGSFGGKGEPVVGWLHPLSAPSGYRQLSHKRFFWSEMTGVFGCVPTQTVLEGSLWIPLLILVVHTTWDNTESLPWPNCWTSHSWHSPNPNYHFYFSSHIEQLQFPKCIMLFYTSVLLHLLFSLLGWQLESFYSFFPPNSNPILLDPPQWST